MNKKIVAAIALLALGVCVIALWQLNKPAGLATLGKEQKEVIKVGAILPLTGNNAYIGQDLREGIDLAVGEINANGGIGNKLVIVVYEDSQGDSKLAIAAFNKLKDIEGASLFVTTLSHVTLALAPLAEESKTPMFTIAVSPSILDAGEFIFINNFDGNQELGFLADFIKSAFEYQKLAIIAQNVEFGIQYKNVLESEWRKRGGTVTAVELVDSSATDYRTQLLKIKDSNPDFVYVVGYAPQITRVLVQARELGMEKRFFSFWGAQENTLLKDAGNAAEGLIFPSSPFSRKSATSFFENFEKKYDKEPNYRAGLAYDIAGILMHALKQCDTHASATYCIKDKIYAIKDYPGVTGPTSITARGGTTKEIIIWQVKNGKFVQLEG